MAKLEIKPGDIFCIPLFMSKDDWKLNSKLRKEDYDKNFVFGRIIEISSYLVVEVFNKIGPATCDLNEIINSGIMLSPVLIFADGLYQ